MLVHLTNFRNTVADARAMVTDAQRQDAAGTFVWHSSARNSFTESAFMKIFIAWEFFLEKTFIDYMLGVPSMNGTAVPRYTTPISAAHANDILIGNQRFADWSSPDTVRKMAKLFFANGEPYETGVGSIHSDITDLKTIRNAASHTSTTTAAALDALASRKLRTTMTGCSVATLLLASDPGVTPPTTFLASYAGLLDGAALIIANA